MTPTPVAASLGSQGPYLGQTWDLFASLDGHVVTFCGTVVARAAGFDEARARYNELRAHGAMAMESLTYTLGSSRSQPCTDAQTRSPRSQHSDGKGAQ